MPPTDPHPPKPKRRWYQFSLRTLLVFVLLASVGLSWFAMKLHQARKQREAVEAILKAGGWVTYDFELADTGTLTPGAEPPAPPWLRKVLGDDFFRDVVRLHVSGPGCGDAELEHLEGLTKLEEVSLSFAQVTDAGLAHLEGLTSLEVLELTGTQVSDAGLQHLRRLTRLRALSLEGTQLTDSGLEHLKGLTRLRFLNLCRTRVTDAGLEDLKTLTRLANLYLFETHVTEEGIKKLQKALPNCTIYH